MTTSKELTSAAFDELRRLIHQRCGLALGDDKAYLIQHRLEPIIAAHGWRSFEQLCTALREPEASQLVDEIVEAVTTRETSFFRDRHPFETFRGHLLPEIARVAARTGRPLRIWSAGVSTGQEAYSLAFLLYDFQRAATVVGTHPVGASILATDVSTAALRVAAAAEYDARQLARGLTPQQVDRYFEPSGSVWRVREPIRRFVEFRRVNLIDSIASLGRFDAIFCRNVLIYFDD
ncbi:MAG: protein-glutamate O-methyltransferase CheR, partial [Pirellulaceae bacterium]